MTGHPVLEVGGTHVLASRVDAEAWRMIPESACRLPLDSGGTADEILGTMAGGARQLGPMASQTLAVAMPGPFDYATGVGRFHGVGKFDALDGVDVGRELAARLDSPPARVAFVNDAAAFAVGEWVTGTTRGYQRAVAITLGTGIGSAFTQAGRVVSGGPDVPPGGHVHRLLVAGRPLEETVSRRAILAAYQRLAPSAPAGGLDVRQIAARALGGDQAASRIFREAFCQLGVALAPWLARFAAQVLVVGGGVTASWSLIEAPLRCGLGPIAGELAIIKSADPDAAAAVGAAWLGRDGLDSAPAGFARAGCGPAGQPDTLTNAGRGGR